MILSSFYSYNNFLKSDLWMNPNYKIHPKVSIRLEDTLNLMKYLIWNRPWIHKVKELAWPDTEFEINFIHKFPMLSLEGTLMKNVREMSPGLVFFFFFKVMYFVLLLYQNWLGHRLLSKVQNAKRKIRKDLSLDSFFNRSGNQLKDSIVSFVYP